MANPQAPWPVRKGIFRSSGQSDFIPTRSPSPIVEMPLSPPPVTNNVRASSLSRFDNNCPLSPPPQPIQVIQGPPGPVITTTAASLTSSSAQSSSSSSSASASASTSSSSQSSSSSSRGQNQMSQSSAASSARMSAAAASCSARSVRKNSLPPNLQQFAASSTHQHQQQQQSATHTTSQNHKPHNHLPPSTNPKNIRQIPIEVERSKVRKLSYAMPTHPLLI